MRIVSNQEYNRLQQFNKVKKLFKVGDEMWKNLSDLDWDHIQDILSIIRLVKNKMLLSSTKIRKLEEIMYRDWMSDCADLIEKEMMRLYNLKKQPEESIEKTESLDNE